MQNLASNSAPDVNAPTSTRNSADTPAAQTKQNVDPRVVTNTDTNNPAANNTVKTLASNSAPDVNLPTSTRNSADAPAAQTKQNFDQRVIVNTDTSDPAVNKAVQNLANKHPDNSVVIAPNADGSHTIVQGTLANGGSTKVEVVGHGKNQAVGGLDSKQITDVVKNLASDGKTQVDKVALVGCGTACAKDGNSLVTDVSNLLAQQGATTEVKGYETSVKVNEQGRKTPAADGDSDALGKNGLPQGNAGGNTYVDGGATRPPSPQPDYPGAGTGRPNVGGAESDIYASRPPSPAPDYPDASAGRPNVAGNDGYLRAQDGGAGTANNRDDGYAVIDGLSSGRVGAESDIYASRPPSPAPDYPDASAGRPNVAGNDGSLRAQDMGTGAANSRDDGYAVIDGLSSGRVDAASDIYVDVGSTRPSSMAPDYTDARTERPMVAGNDGSLRAQDMGTGAANSRDDGYAVIDGLSSGRVDAASDIYVDVGSTRPSSPAPDYTDARTERPVVAGNDGSLRAQDMGTGTANNGDDGYAVIDGLSSGRVDAASDIYVDVGSTRPSSPAPDYTDARTERPMVAGNDGSLRAQDMGTGAANSRDDGYAVIDGLSSGRVDAASDIYVDVGSTRPSSPAPDYTDARTERPIVAGNDSYLQAQDMGTGTANSRDDGYAVIDGLSSGRVDAASDIYVDVGATRPSSPAPDYTDASDAPAAQTKQTFDQRVIVNTDTRDPAVNKAVQNLANKHPDNSVVIAPKADGSHTVLQGTLANGGSTKVEVVGHGKDQAVGGLDSKQITDVVKNLASEGKTQVDKVALVGCGTACAKDGNSLVNDVSNLLAQQGATTEVKGYETGVKVNEQGRKTPAAEGDIDALGKNAPLGATEQNKLGQEQSQQKKVEPEYANGYWENGKFVSNADNLIHQAKQEKVISSEYAEFLDKARKEVSLKLETGPVFVGETHTKPEGSLLIRQMILDGKVSALTVESPPHENTLAKTMRGRELLNLIADSGYRSLEDYLNNAPFSDGYRKPKEIQDGLIYLLEKQWVEKSTKEILPRNKLLIEALSSGIKLNFVDTEIRTGVRQNDMEQRNNYMAERIKETPSTTMPGAIGIFGAEHLRIQLKDSALNPGLQKLAGVDDSRTYDLSAAFEDKVSGIRQPRWGELSKESNPQQRARESELEPFKWNNETSTYEPQQYTGRVILDVNDGDRSLLQAQSILKKYPSNTIYFKTTGTEFDYQSGVYYNINNQENIKIYLLGNNKEREKAIDANKLFKHLSTKEINISSVKKIANPERLPALSGSATETSPDMPTQMQKITKPPVAPKSKRTMEKPPLPAKPVNALTPGNVTTGQGISSQRNSDTGKTESAHATEATQNNASPQVPKTKQVFDQRVIVNTDTRDPAVNKAVQNLANKHPDNSVVIAPKADGSHTVLQGTLANGGSTKVEVVGHGKDQAVGGLDSKQITDVVKNLASNGKTSIDKLALVGCGTACAKDGNSLVNDVNRLLQQQGATTEVKGYETAVKVNEQGRKKPAAEGAIDALGKGSAPTKPVATAQGDAAIDDALADLKGAYAQLGANTSTAGMAAAPRDIRRFADMQFTDNFHSAPTTGGIINGHMVGDNTLLAMQYPGVGKSLPDRAAKDQAYLVNFADTLSQVHTVVDLTNLADRDKHNLLDYRPMDRADKPFEAGGFKADFLLNDVVEVAGIDSAVKGKLNVSLTSPDGKTTETSVNYLNAPVVDHGTMDTNWLNAIASEINNARTAARDEGKCVGVHCTAGVGRTGLAIVAAQLQDAHNAGVLTSSNTKSTVDGLIQELRQQRGKLMVQTDAQYGKLLEYSKQLAAGDFAAHDYANLRDISDALKGAEGGTDNVVVSSGDYVNVQVKDGKAQVVSEVTPNTVAKGTGDYINVEIKDGKAQVVPEVALKPQLMPDIASSTKVAPEVAPKPKAAPEVAPKPKVAPEVSPKPKVAPEVSPKPKMAPEVAPKPKVPPVPAKPGAHSADDSTTAALENAPLRVREARQDALQRRRGAVLDAGSNHQVVVQVGDDNLTTDAAKNLTGKHPTDSTHYVMQADGSLKLVYGPAQTIAGQRLKVQVVGHGSADGATIGGADIDALRNIVDQVTQQFGDQPNKITLAGCNTAACLAANLQEQYPHIKIAGFDTTRAIDADGRKRNVDADDPRALMDDRTDLPGASGDAPISPRGRGGIANPIREAFFGSKDTIGVIEPHIQANIDHRVARNLAEEVELPGKAGNLRGYLYKASEAAPVDKVVLFLHGSGGGGQTQALEVVDEYKARGISVLAVDGRGYGNSDGKPSEKGLYADAASMYDYLVNIKKVDPKSILIQGYSMGAPVAAKLAAKQSVQGKPVGGLLLDRPMPSTVQALEAHKDAFWNPLGLGSLVAKTVNGRFSVVTNLKGLSDTPVMLLSDSEGLGLQAEILRGRLENRGYSVKGEQTPYEHTDGRALMADYADKITEQFFKGASNSAQEPNKVKAHLAPAVPGTSHAQRDGNGDGDAAAAAEGQPQLRDKVNPRALLAEVLQQRRKGMILKDGTAVQDDKEQGGVPLGQDGRAFDDPAASAGEQRQHLHNDADAQTAKPNKPSTST
ncbi:alpha/beta fold hydrolase [Pseudomonas turukhanskensis]|uniref:alpha/beta fold hydrolase n=1 Tax=Pseudomonas turukhanskensis TaxID=1806536 RepID=UPI0022F2BD1C|nr:alpha/beta fold hydrolase [Pseudomonas turukhanskensis]